MTTDCSAQRVKELREKTGAGMLDCKKALESAKGDMKLAMEGLRKQGLSIAAKKAGRKADEGVIGHWIASDAKSAALVEINCETDFVAKTEDFQSFVRKVTTLIVEKGPQHIDALMSLGTQEGTLKDSLTAVIAKIGENIGIRRFVRLTSTPAEVISQYIHAGNKIGVVLLFSDPNHKLSSNTAKEIAMHTAAMSPRFVRREDVPESVLHKEREILAAQLADQKKPPEIVEKIVLGKLTKFYSENCLEEQLFVCDPQGKSTVQQVLKVLDPQIRIKEMARLQVGEEKT